MTNFSINFSNSWFLLLLIPALALTLLPYFRLAKKYRRTRNRIVSIALHLVIMTLAIFVLAGITFEYDTPNSENEVILLVDASDSAGEDNQTKMDLFIQDVIDSSDSMFKLGIVTFGFDQVYAAELTNDTKDLYNDYLRAERPDTTATDIASALTYSSTLFKHPESARIVLLSDGVETDNRAKEVIKQIAAMGIKVDTVSFANTIDSEVQIVSIETPDYNVRVGEKFKLKVNLQSNYVGDATLTLYDNSDNTSSTTVELIDGDQTLEIETMLNLPGLHSLSIEMTAGTDNLSQNNNYMSYMYLETFDDILILESISEESDSIKSMLNEEYNVTVICTDDKEKMPKTLDQLREYDEIIMLNVADKDLPDGFDEILYSYVHDIGGGLFTVCGGTQESTPENPIANAFTRDDMYGSIYQEMLPVEIVNYTPPVAVMIIIDRSGSMWIENVPEEQTPLYAAKQGAEACLDALTERDWVGIMTLDDTYNEEVELTPRTQREKILSAIDEIEVGGGTVFTGALERAGRALMACDVEYRHIILVSDGGAGDEPKDYLAAARQNADLGITMSFIGIQSEGAEEQMRLLIEEAGMDEDHYHNFGLEEIDLVPSEMRKDLEVEEIKSVNYETFQPTIESFGSIVNNISQKDIPTLDGFYGSRAKNGAEVVFMGAHVPIYAQWKFGKGMVGSFMCDLNGTWSSDFISSTTGEMIVDNIITGLFPTTNIKPSSVSLSVSEENYYNKLSIFADVADGESILVTVKDMTQDGIVTQTLSPSATDGFSRLTIAIKNPGVHQILVEKKDAQGNVIASASTYKAFSYSQEYNAFIDQDGAIKLLDDIAASGNGVTIKNAYEVFENVVKYLHRVIDPRIVFMIIALCAFLLDIAVRKFKFKWPHEIIRDYKAKKALQNK